MTTHICDLSPSSENPESARDLLYRHGLPEDVIDGVLCLHAQELAAMQRKAHDEQRPFSHMGQPCRPEWLCPTAALIDLIDPTRNAAAVSAPAPDDTDLSEADIDRMMAAGTPVQIVTEPPATFAAVSAPVQPPTTHWDFCAPSVTRADVLGEAANVVAAMNEGCSRRKPCTSCNTREDVVDELRRMAGEEQPTAEARTEWHRDGGFDQYDDYRTAQPAVVARQDGAAS